MEAERQKRRAEAGGAPARGLLSGLLSVFVFVAALQPAGASGPPQIQNPPPGQNGSRPFHVEVDLVVLPVTVTDGQRHFFAGLTQNEFRIYENGRPQTIAQFSHDDLPVTVGLVLDSSGSMRPNRGEVTQAAKDFLLSSNPQDEVFVVNFNESVSFGLPASVPFTSNVEQLEEAVLRGPSYGMTALYDALGVALKHLSQATIQKKALILISDGGDNASHEGFQQVLASARHGNAIIYTIGILSENAADVNPDVLRKLARETGGQAFFPESAEKLPAICRKIARDLREQYTLAYVSTDTRRDGKYRTIRVTVRAPGHEHLRVRTRDGYYAPSGEASGTGRAQTGAEDPRATP